MDRTVGLDELLDGPLDDTPALVGNLRDLARINRWTGGAALSERAVADLAATSTQIALRTILDVGTGGGDIPARLLASSRLRGAGLVVTAADSRPEILAAARVARPELDELAGLTFALADGRGLPWPDGSFDVAHASLVLHHLSADEAVAFLRELRRVARLGVVVNDLVRGRLYWIGGWLLVRAIATSRFTRHDGPLSVRRAYTRAELRDLVAAAGLTTVATRVGLAGHRVAIAAR